MVRSSQVVRNMWRRSSALLGLLLGAFPRPAAALEGGVATSDASTVALCERTSGGACAALRCSGVLLTSRLVLTARHCVTERAAALSCGADVEGPLRAAPTAFAVTTSDAVAAATSWTRVVRIDLPRAQAPCGGNDLALLTLESALAGAPRAPTFDVGDAAFDVVGYGGVAADGTGAGARRTVSNSRLECVGGRDSCAAFGPGILEAGEVLLDARACGGDSGGGAFARGRVAAILSRTMEASACGASVFGTLDAHALLLAAVARRATPEGEALPAWVAEAEARGNGPGRGVGVSCDADEDCDSRMCRSADAGRHFVCATPCAGGCACRPSNDGDVCFDAKSNDGGCAVARDASSSVGPGLVALAALFVAASRRRRRAASAQRM